MRTATSRPGPGWRELAEARWDDARARFVEALAAVETAEAHEGLSWAAWWLDDAATVFASRERAYVLYRRRGDAEDAARVATWLAADALDFHGAAAVARGWLSRAHRLLDPLPDGPDHGWLAFHEGYLAHGAAESADAVRLARRAAGLGRRFGVPDLEMLGLALEGASLVACAEVADGLRRLDEATAAALEGEATVPISSAWTCCFLVSACLAVHDVDRAAAWCDRIGRFAERYGSRYLLGFCRAEYGTVRLWRGEWAQAEALLQDAVQDLAASRPAWVAAPLLALAELRRRQGRPAETLALLERAGAGAGVLLGRARLALDGGDPAAAVELLERLLRQAPVERALARAPALELLAHARAAGSDLDEAAAAAAELRDVAVLAGTPPFLAAADRAEAAALAAAGRHAEARPLLEDAVDAYARAGAPFEAALARRELSAVLAALGRRGDAARESRTAATALAALGAGGPPAAPLLPQLTPREREVAALLVQGLTNRQIAGRLVISEHTVHRHVTNVLRKLDVASRTAAAAVMASEMANPGDAAPPRRA